MKTSAGSRYRWVRWSVLLMTLVTSVALLATAWSSYATVHRASETVVRGHIEAVFHAVMSSMREVSSPYSQAELDEIVASLEQLGLRYLAIFDDRDRIISQSGQTRTTTAELERIYANADPGDFYALHGRIQKAMRPPPDHPRDDFPPPPDEMLGLRPPPPPHFLIEIEPFIAQQLEGEASIALVVGIVAAGVLIIAGFLTWQLILRTEDLAQRSEREERLAALGTMSAVMAHEIRNPLASLKGHAQLLLEGCPESDPRHPEVDRVVTETIRLESLTSELLDFARGNQIERQAVSPVELVRQACDECASVRYDLRLEKAPQRWSLDPLRMHQVLVNLLRNAAVVTPEGQAVEVTVSNSNARLAMTIRDHGEGFPSELAERVFDPFVTTRVRGTGLGLAIAKSIVELHGGTIAAHNHAAGGAVIEIQIPPGDLN